VSLGVAGVFPVGWLVFTFFGWTFVLSASPLLDPAFHLLDVVSSSAALALTEILGTHLVVLGLCMVTARDHQVLQGGS
jgi:hypothetical protein